jgi:uncharacterized protein YicC (UPF0701 family)
MTGQGHASEQGELGTVSVEIRTVNNRGFKFSPRVSDSLATLESKMEAVTRSLIHRGTVHLTVSWRRVASESLPNVDVKVLQAYLDQLAEVQADAALNATVDLAALMTLPGVIGSVREDRRDDAGLWSLVE